jgi:hypothetical protein
MKGKPFFVELYNLHLSGQIPPTPEEKRKLTETILTNHKLSYLIIASERKGFYTFHQESEPYKLKRWEGWVYLPIGACISILDK